LTSGEAQLHSNGALSSAQHPRTHGPSPTKRKGILIEPTTWISWIVVIFHNPPAIRWTFRPNRVEGIGNWESILIIFSFSTSVSYSRTSNAKDKFRHPLRRAQYT
jgi:hypothetical protein